MVTPLLVVLAAVAPAEPPVDSVEDLPRLLGEEFDLLLALDQLDEDRREQEQALSENQARREEVIRRRDTAARRHTAARGSLETERRRIRRRIRVYIELKQTRDWQLLASTRDYATFLRLRRLLRELIAGDEQRILQYHEVVRRYRTAESTHNNELRALEDVENAITDARSRLERDRAIKAALLESVRSEKAFFIKAGQDLDKAAAELQERIANFEEWRGKRLWFRDLKGQYLYPLPGGRISKSFGKHTHPTFGTVTMHRGIDMVPGRRGNRMVRGIYWGRVAYAGWLRGYGHTVILDHTKGDYSLYAHLSQIDVAVGDVLKSRDTIGVIGKSGALGGEHLYFELRIGGNPVDPVKWFRSGR